MSEERWRLAPSRVGEGKSCPNTGLKPCWALEEPAARLALGALTSRRATYQAGLQFP